MRSWLTDLLPLRRYGTHVGITCDGCGVKPLSGYRMKCRDCKNHDICESCYDAFKTGVLKQHEKMARVNPCGNKVEDHHFEAHCETDASFTQMGGEKVKPKARTIVKKAAKPNDKCPCGSGKKFKKCCSGK